MKQPPNSAAVLRAPQSPASPTELRGFATRWLQLHNTNLWLWTRGVEMNALKAVMLVLFLLTGSGCLQSDTRVLSGSSAVSVGPAPNNLVAFDYVLGHSRPGFLTNSFWNIRVNHFQWSHSPVESISRLENMARTLADAPAIRFFWPTHIDQWRPGVLSLTDEYETGTIADLLLNATSAAKAGSDGLIPVFFDGGVFVTQPRRDIFFKRNLVIEVVDQNSELPLTNALFSSDTMVQPDHVEYKEGSYLVRVNPQILLHYFVNDWALINYNDLDETLTLRIQREGYQAAEISVGVIGDIRMDDFFYVPLTPLSGEAGVSGK